MLTRQAVGGDVALLCIAELAEQLGSEYMASEARSVAERVAEGRFYVACVGQFKRGKSTLLDALIGDSILPTGVVPVTAIPTVIRYGQSRSARVRFQSGQWTDIDVAAIEQYVAEEWNPENAKQVAGVEVFVPNTILASGMSLVDTPGLGSVFSGNTTTTHAFVPHIDAAIVVIGADPPITADELSLVEKVAEHVRDLIFVLNKADRVSDHERVTATAFARKVLESRIHHPMASIFEVSALERVERRGNERDWPLLVHALDELLRLSGRRLVHEATNRAVTRIGRQLLTMIGVERDALLRPVEESESRIGNLREMSAQAEQSLHELGYLFSAEQQRLSKTLQDRRNDFLEVTLVSARQELDARLAGVTRRNGPAFRRDLMHIAQEVARDQLTPWLQAEEIYAEEAYGRIAKRFVDLANDFLRRLREAGLPDLATLPDDVESEQGFRTKSRFYFLSFEHVAAPASPFRNLADLVLGVLGASGGVIADTQVFLDHLLQTNSSRVQNDVEERVSESRRRLEREIRRILRDVSEIAERALGHARTAQMAGENAVRNAVAGLDAAGNEIRRLVSSTEEQI
jgi:GTPase SAR1 family protein